jgi:Flp pilus assembly protein TadG
VAFPVQAVKRKAESGAILVEFALVLLPTLGFLFLLMTLAWVIFAWACIQEGVREGARAAVTCTPATGLNAAVQQVVKQYSFGFVNSANSSSVLSIRYYDPITLQPVTGNVVTGDVVKITVSGLRVYQFAPILLTYTPLYVSAISADVMSCPSPATP